MNAPPEPAVNLEVELAGLEQLPVLRNLMQLYLYDFSLFLCDDPTMQISPEGLYDPGFELTDYLQKPGHWAYLAYLDGKLAGFALISDRLRYRNGGGRIMDEFFVLRCCRRQGVGRQFAHTIFDSAKGYWEVAEIPTNKPAQEFWRKVIGEYTSDNYQERIGSHQEVWQIFDIRA